MKIWKTEEEAKVTTCFKQQRPAGGEYDFHPCLGPECGHWLPKPCPDCGGNGYKTSWLFGVTMCDYCWGNGCCEDGSNLGRCGLVHL